MGRLPNSHTIWSSCAIGVPVAASRSVSSFMCLRCYSIEVSSFISNKKNSVSSKGACLPVCLTQISFTGPPKLLSVFHTSSPGRAEKVLLPVQSLKMLSVTSSDSLLSPRPPPPLWVLALFRPRTPTGPSREVSASSETSRCSSWLRRLASIVHRSSVAPPVAKVTPASLNSVNWLVFRSA